MSVKPLDTPGVFLDLASLKHHTRVEHDADDDLIESLGAAAVDYFERACSITIAPRSFVFTRDGFPAGPLRIPHPPTTAVSSIVYVGDDGQDRTLDAEHYAVDLSSPARVSPIAPWPATIDRTGSVRVTYSAGYANEAAAPPLLVQGCYLMTGHWYSQRAATSDREAKTVPFAAQAIIELFQYPKLGMGVGC